MSAASDGPRYLTALSLVRADRGDGSFSLYHPGHGTSLDVEPESSELVELLLASFASPTTLAAFFAAQPAFPEALLELMVRSCFVVEEQERAFLEHGFLRPTPTPLGAPWSWSDLPDLAYPGGWVVLGAPVDMAAAGSGGARHGPAELRKVVNGPLLGGEGDVLDHEFKRLYPALQTQVSDLGDVDPDGARMDHVGARIGKVVRELLSLRMRPLLLGGDHSVTAYVLRELITHAEDSSPEQEPAFTRFGIIHFDAHHDMGPSQTLSHANIFAEAIDSECVVSILQIGLRVIERISPFATRTACPKRRIVTAREARAGLALGALEALPRDIPYYLTFDIDCIDAAVARETGTPAFGGLSVEQASELVDYIARTFDLVGADFVEVSGQQTQPNAAALIAASLLQRALLGQSAFEPLTSDVYVF